QATVVPRLMGASSWSAREDCRRAELRRDQHARRSEKQARERADDRSAERVASAEGVTPASRQPPLSGEQHLQPAASREGLQRDIENPVQDSRPGGVVERLEEDPALGGAPDVIAAEDPHQKREASDRRRQAHGAPAVAPSGSEVAAYEHRSADETKKE